MLREVAGYFVNWYVSIDVNRGSSPENGILSGRVLVFPSASRQLVSATKLGFLAAKALGLEKSSSEFHHRAFRWLADWLV